MKIDGSNFIRFNIALKVPDDIAEKAIALSHEIVKNYEAFFILDGKEFYPHVTVYSTEYPIGNREEILTTLEEVSREQKSLHLKFTDVHPAYGWIGINVEAANEILNFHREVVTRLNPLRDNHIKEKYINSPSSHTIKIELTPEQQQNTERYGHPEVMELYKPHMTIIRLKSVEGAEKAAQSLDWDISDFTVESLAVYISGEHGTCRELVKEFSLI